MYVRDRMTADPITVTGQTTIVQALQLMRDNRIRRLPVVDNGKLIGIVTDRDLSEVSPSPATSLSIFELNYLLAKTKIADILPKNKTVFTISPDALLEEAALLMRDNKVSGIPVVSEKNELVGIITETNIFDAFMEIMGIRQEGFRISMPLQSDRPGVLAEITSAITACDGNITHITTYGVSGLCHLVLRINRGDIDRITAALKKLGYDSTVRRTC